MKILIELIINAPILNTESKYGNMEMKEEDKNELIIEKLIALKENI